MLTSGDESEAASAAVIIQIGPAFFVPSGHPASTRTMAELILPEALQSVLGFLPEGSRGSVDIMSGATVGADQVFAILIQPGVETPRDKGREFVKDALQYAWDGLVRLGFVSGEMPEVVMGDPRNLL